MAFERDGYKGNTNLRGIHEEIPMTEEQVIEYAKCASSIEYFLRNYAKIISLDDGIVKFDPYPYQLRITKALKTNRKILVKLFRQSGKCHCSDTKYTIRNKHTGEIMEITAEDFHKMQNEKRNLHQT